MTTFVHTLRRYAFAAAAAVAVAAGAGATHADAAAASPSLVPGQGSAGIADAAALAGSRAAVVPRPLPHAPAPGDTIACAVSTSDSVRARPTGAPSGWNGPYLPGAQVATQQHVRSSTTPDLSLYYHVVRGGEPGALPAFAVALAPNAQPPSMGYECVEVRDVSAARPIYTALEIDVAGDTVHLPPHVGAPGRLLHVFYAFDGAVARVGDAGDAVASGHLAVASASLPSTNPGAIRIAASGSVQGRALLVAFNPRSASDGGYFAELPEWADRFADGAAAMNIRCNQSLYDGCDDTIMAALHDLGIRHVSGIDAAYLNHPALAPIQRLSAAGVDTLSTAGICDTDATIAALNTIPSVRYGAMTYPNEIDTAKAADFDCRAHGLDDYGTWQNWWLKRAPQVFAVMKRTRPDVPVLGQSFGGALQHYCSNAQEQTDGDCSGVGDALSRYEDVVNLHQYAGGHYPLGSTGNAHEHCGKTGTLFNFACYASFIDPSGRQPRWFGERGYNDTGVAGSIVATYLPVDEMVQRLSGFSRYYFFNLVDGASGFASTGLMTAKPAFARKPQFYALQSLIQLLSDRGAPFEPNVPVDYRLDGATSSTFHYLVQYRSGRYAFLVSNVVPLTEVDAANRAPSTTQELTLAFPNAPRNVEIARYDTDPSTPEPHGAGCSMPAARPVRYCFDPAQRLPATHNADGSYSVTFHATPAMTVVFFDLSGIPER